MKKLITTIAALVVIALMVTSCGAPETPAPSTTAPPATAPSTGAPPAGAPPSGAPPAGAPPSGAPPAGAPPATAPPTTTLEPQYGGILKVGSPDRLGGVFGDPINMFAPSQLHASPSLERLFDPLEPGKHEPVLATGYKLAPDKSYYDISLRQGVKFHDGSDFNAQAVKWNLDRAKAASMTILEKVESIEVIDDYTVRLNLSSWNNRILNDLLWYNCFMISPIAFEEHGQDWANFHPVGTGPFVFKEVKNDQIEIYEKNENYWHEGLPYLDGVEIYSIPDPMTLMMAYKAGEVDGTIPLGEENAAEMEKDPNSNVWISDELPMQFRMNTGNPESAWYDVRMRQALEYAIDKETVCDTVASPAVPAYNVIAGLEKATDVGIIPRKYDPAKAKALVAEAGYADGVEFTMYVGSRQWTGGGYEKAFLVWQEQWAEAGLKVNFEVIEFTKALELDRGPLPGVNDVLASGPEGNPENPIEVVCQNFTEPVLNRWGVAIPEGWADLYNQALQTLDPAEQVALLVQMDQLAYDNAMMVPLINLPWINCFNIRVHGGEIDKQGLHIADTWLSK